jgi:hypothetical protein
VIKFIHSKNKKFLTVLLPVIIFSAIIFFIFKSEILRTDSNNSLSNTSNGIVRLTVETEYNEYYTDQLIWIKVIVINDSKSDYYLKYPLKRLYIQFKASTPSGNKIYESLNSDTAVKTDSLLLKPGSSFEKVMPLNTAIEQFYGEDKKETGIYKINAKYQNLISNDFDISVTEPTGVNKEIYEQTYEKLFKPEIPQYDKIQKLGEALKKYPVTKYTPQLYKLYFDESNYSKDYNNNSDEINNFFESNYDTYGADLILDVGNVNFEKLLSKYRDSKTGYMIRQRRKEVLTLK